MTRKQKLATFTELTKVDGVHTGSCYADRLRFAARILFDHPASHRDWQIMGPGKDAGFWHLRSDVIIGKNHLTDTLEHTSHTLLIHETEFERLGGE